MFFFFQNFNLEPYKMQKMLVAHTKTILFFENIFFKDFLINAMEQLK